MVTARIVVFIGFRLYNKRDRQPRGDHTAVRSFRFTHGLSLRFNMQLSTPPTNRLLPTDVIDLAHFFHRDQELPHMEKHERDRDIALAHPDANDDTARLCTWLHVMRQRQGMDGQRPMHDMQHGLSLVLFVMGLALGALTVGGWLSLNKLLSPQAMPQSGINVIYFWSVTAGWQLLMLLVILTGLVLGDWADYIPGLSSLRRLLRRLPSLIPKIAEMLISRFRPSQQQALHTLQAWLTQSQRYRRLAFWYPLNLSQRFAVGFNLGLIGMFVFLSFATQPVFGWQSGQLNCTRLERVTRVIASPWYWLNAKGRPSANDIRSTYYQPDSLHAHTDCGGDTAPGPVNPGWWPFLFASMLVYGLIPRALLNALSSWQMRRAAHDVALHHPDSRELLLRMQRPLVDTGARLQTAPSGFNLPIVAPELQPEQQTVSFGRGFVLKWAGIQLPDDEIQDLVRRQWGIDTAALYEVGGLDVSRDEEALHALETSHDIDQVMLLVEAWQPPVTDFRNFVTQLRQTLRDGKMIWVLLYHRDTDVDIVTPRESDLDQWRMTLERIDAWLRVKPMIEEPA